MRRTLLVVLGALLLLLPLAAAAGSEVDAWPVLGPLIDNPLTAEGAALIMRETRHAIELLVKSSQLGAKQASHLLLGIRKLLGAELQL